MRTAADPGPLDPSVDVDGFVRHRYAVLAALRAQAPAVFVPELGLWALTRYDVVRAMLGDPVRFPCFPTRRVATDAALPETPRITTRGVERLPVVVGR